MANTQLTLQGIKNSVPFVHERKQSLDKMIDDWYLKAKHKGFEDNDCLEYAADKLEQILDVESKWTTAEKYFETQERVKELVSNYYQNTMDIIDIFYKLSAEVKDNFSRLLGYAKSGKLNAIIIQENSGMRADCTTSAVMIEGVVFTDCGIVPHTSSLFWGYAGNSTIPTIDDILRIKNVMNSALFNQTI
jgi:Txe/YoeB family toxin of Txe-Axe toxin-antitoxin module